mgnify:CR=1 FL=1
MTAADAIAAGANLPRRWPPDHCRAGSARSCSAHRARLRPDARDMMIALTLYSRPGCHLCDEMKAVIARVVGEQAVDITLEEVDISTDAELESRYGTEIPCCW